MESKGDELGVIRGDVSSDHTHPYKHPSTASPGAHGASGPLRVDPEGRFTSGKPGSKEAEAAEAIQRQTKRYLERSTSPRRASAHPYLQPSSRPGGGVKGVKGVGGVGGVAKGKVVMAGKAKERMQAGVLLEEREKAEKKLVEARHQANQERLHRVKLEKQLAQNISEMTDLENRMREAESRANEAIHDLKRYRAQSDGKESTPSSSVGGNKEGSALRNLRSQLKAADNQLTVLRRERNQARTDRDKAITAKIAAERTLALEREQTERQSSKVEELNKLIASMSHELSVSTQKQKEAERKSRDASAQLVMVSKDKTLAHLHSRVKTAALKGLCMKLRKQYFRPALQSAAMQAMTRSQIEALQENYSIVNRERQQLDALCRTLQTDVTMYAKRCSDLVSEHKNLNTDMAYQKTLVAYLKRTLSMRYYASQYLYFMYIVNSFAWKRKYLNKCADYEITLKELAVERDTTASLRAELATQKSTFERRIAELELDLNTTKREKQAQYEDLSGQIAELRAQLEDTTTRLESEIAAHKVTTRKFERATEVIAETDERLARTAEELSSALERLKLSEMRRTELEGRFGTFARPSQQLTSRMLQAAEGMASGTLTRVTSSLHPSSGSGPPGPAGPITPRALSPLATDSRRTHSAAPSNGTRSRLTVSAPSPIGTSGVSGHVGGAPSGWLSFSSSPKARKRAGTDRADSPVSASAMLAPPTAGPAGPETVGKPMPSLDDALAAAEGRVTPMASLHQESSILVELDGRSPRRASITGSVGGRRGSTGRRAFDDHKNRSRAVTHPAESRIPTLQGVAHARLATPDTNPIPLLSHDEDDLFQPPRTIHLLVCTEDHKSRALMLRGLPKRQFRVSEANSIPEAAEILEREVEHPVKLLICDYQVKGECVTSLLEMLRNPEGVGMHSTLSIPVVVTSRTPDEDASTHCRMLGAVAFLVRPLSMTKMLSLIRVTLLTPPGEAAFSREFTPMKSFPPGGFTTRFRSRKFGDLPNGPVMQPRMRASRSYGRVPLVSKTSTLTRAGSASSLSKRRRNQGSTGTGGGISLPAPLFK